MNLEKIHEINFDKQDPIKAVALSATDELILLLASGRVFRYSISRNTFEMLFSVNSVVQYKDGGFDIEAPSTIYTLDSIVVLVNDYKRHGFVHYPERYNRLHLWRGEYHAHISCYPIALFKSHEGIPHIIYGEDWNHLQIMNLDTQQIVTAAKSLIEEGAEEQHIEFYKKYKGENKLPWPRPYDYFYGKLLLSPDQQHFLSAGWVWGSFDAYTIYNIQDFISNPRIVEKQIGGWEHNDRPVCWIDHQSVAVAYSPLEEGDEDATEESPNEIHIYEVGNKQSSIKKKIIVEGLYIMNAKMHFHTKRNAFILFSEKLGLIFLSMDGTLLFQEKTTPPDAYYPKFDLFLKKQESSVSIYQV